MKTKITFLKATFLMAGLFIASSVSAQTLEAHYKFDGDLNDASVNSRTISIDGTWVLNTDIALSTTDKVVGTHGLDVTGNGTNSNQLITAAAAPASLTGNSSRTITAWIKIAPTSAARTIAGLGVSGVANQRFDFLVTNTGLIRCEKTGTGFVGVSVDDNNWNFVAITYEEGSAKLYVGTTSTVTEVGSAPWSNIATLATEPMVVANGAQNDRAWLGGLDDVRFYSGALTKTELEAIMGGGTLGVNDVAFGADELKAYPNAVTDFLNIKTSVSEKLDITIYNTLGKLVDRTNGTRVDMSDLSSGLYIVNVRAGAKVASLKIFKK